MGRLDDGSKYFSGISVFNDPMKLSGLNGGWYTLPVGEVGVSPGDCPDGCIFNLTVDPYEKTPSYELDTEVMWRINELAEEGYTSPWFHPGQVFTMNPCYSRPFGPYNYIVPFLDGPNVLDGIT